MHCEGKCVFPHHKVDGAGGKGSNYAVNSEHDVVTALLGGWRCDSRVRVAERERVGERVV